MGTLRADHRTNKRHETTVPRRGGIPTSVLERDLEHLCGVGNIGVIPRLGQQTLGLGLKLPKLLAEGQGIPTPTVAHLRLTANLLEALAKLDPIALLVTRHPLGDASRDKPIGADARHRRSVSALTDGTGRGMLRAALSVISEARRGGRLSPAGRALPTRPPPAAASKQPVVIRTDSSYIRGDTERGGGTLGFIPGSHPPSSRTLSHRARGSKQARPPCAEIRLFRARNQP